MTIATDRVASTLALIAAAAALSSSPAPQALAASTPAATMDTRRASHTATLLQNGKVLVWGGIDLATASNPHSSGEVYDWSANTWSSGPAMTIAREQHSATLLASGKVLVVGGWDGAGTIIGSAELYDPVTDRSTVAASLPFPRTHHSATLLPDGRVLVAGGLSNRTFTSDAQLYDPASDTWTIAASLTAARGAHSATLLPNGRVLVVGGTDGSRALGSAELYDPASDSWTVMPVEMTQGRQRHAAVLLPNGKILVLGGSDNGFGGPSGTRVLTSNELYDPVADAWTEAPALGSARQNFTATSLPNGLVLVAGGQIQEGSATVATAELYAGSPPQAAAEVVEFYHAILDHYFVTWHPAEIAILDAGTTIRGWERTGLAFKAYTAPLALTNPVCRYLIPPQFGNSHFYGRGTAECEATGRNHPGFDLEDPDFMRMFLPVVGTCPLGTTPVYRVFSDRPDANHRYMTDRSVRDSMIARGWQAEGEGPDVVVMCAPS